MDTVLGRQLVQGQEFGGHIFPNDVNSSCCLAMVTRDLRGCGGMCLAALLPGSFKPVLRRACALAV